MLHTFYLKFVFYVYILLPRAKCRQMLWGVECNKLYLTIYFINSGPWEDLQSEKSAPGEGGSFLFIMVSCFSFPSFSYEEKSALCQLMLVVPWGEESPTCAEPAVKIRPHFPRGDQLGLFEVITKCIMPLH